MKTIMCSRVVYEAGRHTLTKADVGTRSGPRRRRAAPIRPQGSKPDPLAAPGTVVICLDRLIPVFQRLAIRRLASDTVVIGVPNAPDREAPFLGVRRPWLEHGP